MTLKTTPLTIIEHISRANVLHQADLNKQNSYSMESMSAVEVCNWLRDHKPLDETIFAVSIGPEARYAIFMLRVW